VERDAAALAVRSSTRPPEPRDDFIAPEVVKRMETDYAAQTDGRRAALDDLREFAKRERKELESFTKAR
jgi:hypothetical protein